MDAIEYLTDQHAEIESLFDQIDSAARMKTKLRLRRKLFDLLAVHAAIEEMIFYPTAKQAGVEEPLLSAIEEHLPAERMIAEIVEVGWPSDEAAVRMSVLKERKRRHADEEERDLFPRARKLLTQRRLEVLGICMANVADQLMGPGVGARERIAARRVLA